MGELFVLIVGLALIFFLVSIPLLLWRVMHVAVQFNNNLVEFMEYMRDK